jgi:D-lactate dehydrogenase (cytochrome)
MLVIAGIAYYLGTWTPSALPTDSTLPLSNTKKPNHDLDKRTLEALWADFVQIVGKDNVSTEGSDLDIHANSDWSSYQGTKEMKPFLIVYPDSTDEVSKIMKACHSRKVPVTAYSGGTSLEGHIVPTHGGVTVDFSRMNRIIELHKEDLDVVVQPAVGWQELNEELGQVGLFFPPDPGPGAMIGGMVGLLTTRLSSLLIN